jgi:hypothetical protein
MVSRFIDFLKLRVVENRNLWEYQLRAVTNAPLVYVPPPEKNELLQTGWDEVLFLPVTPLEFKVKRQSRVGYRFRFSSSNHSRIHLLGFPDDGVGTYEIGYEVSRLFFRPKGKAGIVIEQECDPLFPKEIRMIQGPDELIVPAVREHIDSILGYFTNYYSTHTI